MNESGLDGIDLPGYNPAAALDELFGGIRACSAKVCETLCRHTEQSSSEQESALLAAVEEQLSDPLFGPEVSALSLALGFVAAFLSGLFACRAMVALVRRAKLYWFSIYCVLAAVLCLFL